MTDPRPLKMDTPAGLEELAGFVRNLDEADAMSGAEVRHRLATAAAQLASQARRRREAVIFCCSAATAALLVWFVAPLISPPRLPEAFVGEVGAVWSRSPGQPVLLTAGRLRGRSSATPMHLVTPHTSLSWTQARFMVAVDTAGTNLFVEEGSVTWRAGATERRVMAGDYAHAPEAVSVPPALAKLEPPADSECAQPAAATRAACLRALAAGDTLKAQNALYEWALLHHDELHAPERAIEGWREYAARFPEGAFRPEVSVGLIVDLIRVGRYGEGLTAVKLHRQRFPDVFPLEVTALEAKLARRVGEGLH